MGGEDPAEPVDWKRTTVHGRGASTTKARRGRIGDALICSGSGNRGKRGECSGNGDRIHTSADDVTA